MTDMAKNLAGTAVGLGGLALVGESMKMIPSDFGAPMRKGKRTKARRSKQVPFVRGAANLMVGTALLGGAAKIVNDM